MSCQGGAACGRRRTIRRSATAILSRRASSNWLLLRAHSFVPRAMARRALRATIAAFAGTEVDPLFRAGGAPVRADARRSALRAGAQGTVPGGAAAKKASAMCACPRWRHRPRWKFPSLERASASGVGPEVQHHFARPGLGNAAAAAKILKQRAELVEVGDHCRRAPPCWPARPTRQRCSSRARPS